MPLTSIVADPAVHSRVHRDDHTVAEYSGAMSRGEVFPAVVVFQEGATYWLADGFMRVEAARDGGLTSVTADVREGGRRDAVLFAAGANAAHGLRRTNADKRRAVEMLLADPEWVAWSDGQIARAACVSDKTVAKYRRELSATSAHPGNSGVSGRRYHTKHGSAAVMRIPAGPCPPRRGSGLFLGGSVPKPPLAASGPPGGQPAAVVGRRAADADPFEPASREENSGGPASEMLDALLRAAGQLRELGADVLRTELGPPRLADASSRIRDLLDLLEGCMPRE